MIIVENNYSEGPTELVTSMTGRLGTLQYLTDTEYGCYGSNQYDCLDNLEPGENK